MFVTHFKKKFIFLSFFFLGNGDYGMVRGTVRGFKATMSGYEPLCVLSLLIQLDFSYI